MNTNKVKNIMSIEKTLNLIELMADYGAPIRLQDLADIADMPKATVYRLINTLKNKGYVKQDLSSSRYYLSLKIFSIGTKISENISINNISVPFLKKLSEECSKSVNFAVVQDNKAIILNIIGGASEAHDITAKLGSAVPLHCTAIGRSLMINYDRNMIDKYMSNTPIIKYTPLTTVDSDTLYEKLNNIKTTGFSYDPGEYRAGIIGISAPILDQLKNPVASISIADLASEITPEEINFLSSKVVNTAKEISKII